MAARLNLGRPVHIQHPHLDQPFAAGLAIAGGEAELERLGFAAGVIHHIGIGSPLEAAVGRVEHHALRRAGVVHQGQAGGLAIGVAGPQREGKRLVLLHKLQGHWQQHRRLVQVPHHQLDLAAGAGAAIAGLQREPIATRRGAIDVVPLGRKQSRCPAQAETRLPLAHISAVHHQAGRQLPRAGHSPAQPVDVAIPRHQIEPEGHPLLQPQAGERPRQGIVAHELGAAGREVEQAWRRVGVAHHDAQVGAGAVGHQRHAGIQDVTRVLGRQAAVLHGQPQVVHPPLVGARGPTERGPAVLGIEVESGAGRQALSAPAQRILIEVARQDRDAQLLSRQGQALARQGEHRRLARAAHRQHEAPGLGGHLVAVAAAIVLGRHGDRVIAAIVGARREADHAAHARGGAWLGGAGLAVAGEGGQPVQAEAHRVAIGIAGAHRDLQHGAAIHEGVAHIADLRRPVGVGHHDRQGDLAHGRRAGAVAVIRGGHGDRVGAGLVVGGGPEQFEGVRIETRPLRQAAHRVAHAWVALPVERGTVGPQAQLRLELRVVGIEGEGADAQGLPLEDRAAVGGLELGGGVGVQHLEHQVAAHAGGDRFAIARRGVDRTQADRDPQLAGLAVAGRPFQPARLGVQAGAARQPGGAVLQLNAAAIRLAEAAGHAAGQLQCKPLSLPQDLLAQRPEHRFGVALLHMEVEAFDNRVLAVAGHDRHIVVRTRLVVTGGPLQGAAAGVVAGAGGQVAQGDGQAIAIGIGHAQGQVEAFPLLERDVAERLDRGQLVGAGHRQAEAAQGDAAAAVHHPHHHLAVDPVVGCGCPAEAGAGGVVRLGPLH